MWTSAPRKRTVRVKGNAWGRRGCGVHARKDSILCRGSERESKEVGPLRYGHVVFDVSLCCWFWWVLATVSGGFSQREVAPGEVADLFLHIGNHTPVKGSVKKINMVLEYLCRQARRAVVLNQQTAHIGRPQRDAALPMHGSNVEPDGNP